MLRRADNVSSKNESDAPCFCSDAILCDTIRTVHRKEVYGFKCRGGPAWRDYDWSQVTTVAWNDDDELTCYAHSKGARVIMAASMPLPLTDDKAERQKWIASSIQAVKARHMDGIVFDYEDPLPPRDPRAGYYVDLINETTQAFHEAIPGSQVSVCVAWSPNNIDGRYYDNLGMIQAADLAYIMDYDTRSQVFDQCIASANAALPTTALGLEQYLALGADPDKLVLGVPWYGYDYPCTNQDDPKTDVCWMPLGEFRGVNCTDAVGGQRAYRHIMEQLANGNTTTGRQFEPYLQAPWFNYRVEGTGEIKQTWYDDAQSLTPKYALAKKLGLRGVGPFCFDYLDATGQDPPSKTAAAESAAMWDALKTFTT